MDNSDYSVDKKLPAKDIHKSIENNDDNSDSSISINKTHDLIN